MIGLDALGVECAAQTSLYARACDASLEALRLWVSQSPSAAGLRPRASGRLFTTCSRVSQVRATHDRKEPTQS
jgi:hypothetical protein